MIANTRETAAKLKSDNCKAILLRDVPVHHRERVLSGMRWSVWLSVLAVPCSAVINLILARVSPETVGTYGLLSVYIGLIIALLYFGGDTVVIRFIPECAPVDRASFLVSYLTIVFCIVGGWLLFAWLCPRALDLVLGHGRSSRSNFFLLCLAPLPIAFYVVVAALKGMLEMRLAQTLAKLLTVISMVAYVVLFVFARELLSGHPTAVVWTVYVATSGLLALSGARRLFQLCGRPHLRFYLPEEFWWYAIDTQMVGAIRFLSGRLDYVLLLNFGGLALLGSYVAITAVATTVPLVSNLFMDTLLPSLTNMVSVRNSRGAGQVFMMHMRLLFPITVAAGCALILLAVPATEVMGPKYRPFASLIVLMTAFQAIGSPGIHGGTLLCGIGRQRLAIGTSLLGTALFAALFFATWPRWHLLGAVCAAGLALLVSNWALMIIGLKVAGFAPSVSGLWLRAAAVLFVVGALALWWMPVSPVAAVTVWVAAVGAFLWVADYSIPELEFLVSNFLPRRRLERTGTCQPNLNPCQM